VHPEAQHKGYGTSLLNKGIETFKGQYDTVYLEVDNKMLKVLNIIKIMALKSCVRISQKCMANIWI